MSNCLIQAVTEECEAFVRTVFANFPGVQRPTEEQVKSAAAKLAKQVASWRHDFGPKRKPTEWLGVP